MISTVLGKIHDVDGGLAPVIGFGGLLFGGLGVGLLTLVGYER
jgi:hypothetical protein